MNKYILDFLKDIMAIDSPSGYSKKVIHYCQKEAEKLAKQYSANSGGGEVRIHRPDAGPIRDSDTVKPGNDPSSSRDTKY